MISVIVPVYNVEPYLRRCVQSLLRQTYSNLEILLMDDGSTDRSGVLCDELADTDSRIRVIHQSNGGLSHARNRGMELAAGEYIAFLDSDDWADPTWLETLHRLCISHNAQIAECSYRNMLPQVVTAEGVCSGGVMEFTPMQAMECNLKWQHCKPVAWNKLYRRDITEGIRFPVGKYHEDEFTTHLFYLAAEKIVYGDIALVNYERRNPSSITARFTLRNLDACQALRQRLHLIWGRPDLAPIAERAANVYLWTVFDRWEQCRLHGLTGDTVTRTIHDLLEDYPLLLLHPFDRSYIPAIRTLAQGGDGV